jgi:hypothetical protein
MKSTGLFYHPPVGSTEVDPTEEEYAALLKQCDVVEIKGGVDFDAVARFGMAFLENRGIPPRYSDDLISGLVRAR